MSEKYKCQIRNHRDDTVMLKAPKNYVYRTLFIQPHTTLTIAFSEEAYFLAPFERVVYKKSGKVETVKRRGFKRDLAFPVVKFLNRGGHMSEVVRVSDNDSQILPLGIEVERSVPFYSHFAEFESVIIAEPKEVVVPVYNSPGQHKTEKRQHIIYKKRNGKDLERLKKMRQVSYLRSIGLGASGE
jgi:hypothetical protein